MGYTAGESLKRSAHRRRYHRRRARTAPAGRKARGDIVPLPTPDVTYILATHNRRDVAVGTLDRILALPDRAVSEVIVVDNASSDGTRRAISERFSAIELISLDENLGSCAKSVAVSRARGRHVVFLDDDSHPRAGSIDRMIQYFNDDDRLGAAGFAVHLPDGRREGGALPHVFVGCGVGFLSDALRQVGGLDTRLFMQAEEYDLAFRLVNAGWRVTNFGDLHVEHLKTPCARISARTTYYDTRNNLIIVDRYLREPMRSRYREDWTQRYRWLASANGQRSSFIKGRLAARAFRTRSRRDYAERRLTDEAFEALFRHHETLERMRALRDSGAERVVFSGLGKNVHAFHRAANEVRLKVIAIADDRFKRRFRRYRGTPVVSAAHISDLSPDAVVVSDMAPVHAAATHAQLSALCRVPVHCWYGADESTLAGQFSSTRPPVPADRTERGNRRPGVTAARPV